MADNFRVAVEYQGQLGYIEYEADKKDIVVHLEDAVGRKAAEEFLAVPHEIRVPHETLLDFSAAIIQPAADVESFKLVLTRLWENTGVRVDWSRPVDYVIAHPTLASTKSYKA
jgi:hypothetical protein